MTVDQKIEALKDLRIKVSKCSLCQLSIGRGQIVFGEGNPDSDILFIGEAPGANEDKTGIPFCGAAGKFLEEMLALINLKRQDIYITNTVKCRPANNRDPLDEEKEACNNFLQKQLEIIEPKLIVLLGKHATKSILKRGDISQIHGRFFRKKDGIIYLPLYHPAAALYNGSMREVLKGDFLKIKKILNK